MKSRLRLWVAVWLGICAAIEAKAGADERLGVPEMAARPAAFAVTPFENHVPNGKALDWIVAEAPFEIAEKTQAALGFSPADVPLYVPNAPVAAEADMVAAFARSRRVQFVITGWFDRIGEDLRIAVVVWRVDPSPQAAGSAAHGGGSNFTGRATMAADVKSQGAMATYHALLGNAVAEAWAKAGVEIDDAKRERFGRALAGDIYPVFMMGRGLGYLVAKDLKNAEHDLERAVFLDPKLFEAQRLLGELYLRRAEPKDAARAAAKFNYALELAPDDIASLRAAATATAAAGQWERALELWTSLVRRLPWDTEARFHLGHVAWQLGNATAAEHQLEQVVAREPDHLPARHILVLIHASRGDTKRLAAELESIALRAPQDLEVKSDLASAYGALGHWDKASAALEAVVAARPNDVAVAVRVGNAQRKRGDVNAAIRWYERAARLAPATSMPGFMIAQAQFDAGKLDAANQTYASLQKFAPDLGATEHGLGVIAFAQRRFDDAAQHFRKAVRDAPRSLESRRAVVAAELERKDAASARQQLEPALVAWPDDGVLHYLAGIAHRIAGDNVRAQAELHRALDAKLPAARLALAAIDAGGVPSVDWQPELVRPWGDSEALAAELDRFAATRTQMMSARAAYQAHFIGLLGALGKGPAATPKTRPGCPAGRIAPRWLEAQQQLRALQHLGVDLEASFMRIIRHDELGLTAGLLPNSRLAVASAKRDYSLALRDVAELRAEWSRGLAPELNVAGCTVNVLAAAAAGGLHSRPVEDEVAAALPVQGPPRPVPRTTFFVDNSACSDPVDVFIDDQSLGRAAPHRRSALVAEGGERSLCLIPPGTAQCGDRGTVRSVYLHDGWTVTMRCVDR